MSLNADFLVSMYGSVLEDRSSLYCSAPITSGRRFVEWVRSRGNDIRDVDHAASEYVDEHRSNVVEPNLMHAKDIIRRLRSGTGLPVIDPTAVPHITAWKQADWLLFWETVIERFAIAAVFINDWQYSYGCAHEFMFAQARGIPTFSENGAVLTLGDGRSLIQRAVVEIDMIGGATSRLTNTLRVEPVSIPQNGETVKTLSEFLANYRSDAF